MSEPENTMCIPCTPGGNNARQVMEGDARAILKEQLYFLERGALVAIGCALAGVRGKQLIKSAVCGGLAMEVFILGYQFFMKRKETP